MSKSMNIIFKYLIFATILLLLLQATYLRAAKVNHIGESEARLIRGAIV